jgi:hypothetical protein
LFFIPLQHFLAYITSRLPYCFWLEEVRGFCTELGALGGLSPASYISRRLRGLGYSCHCLLINHAIWARTTRERCWLFGVHEDAGGAKAAAIIKDIILSALRHLESLNR